MTKYTTLLFSLLAPALASPVPADEPKSSSAQGYVYLLPVTSGKNVLELSPKESIGCLNDQGYLTLDDCALFSRQTTGRGLLSTSSGACSFADSSKPESQAHYSKGTYAWSCGVGDGRGNIEDGSGNIGDGSGNIGDGSGNIGDGSGNIGDGKGNIGDGKGNIGDGKGNIGDGKGNLPIQETGEVFYLLESLTGYPLIGNGNLNFYYDVPEAPKKKEDKLPVWKFNWGSLQTDVPEGHIKVAWLWVPAKP